MRHTHYPANPIFCKVGKNDFLGARGMAELGGSVWVEKEEILGSSAGQGLGTSCFVENACCNDDSSARFQNYCDGISIGRTWRQDLGEQSEMVSVRFACVAGRDDIRAEVESQ
mmetsp:Transcript_33656/g.99172  ORF Transcript_33656/g.99172 Transcript_33656/m.99172 type:complete len:113 (-) Transcript_33656:696-1034(-)